MGQSSFPAIFEASNIGAYGIMSVITVYVCLNNHISQVSILPWPEDGFVVEGFVGLVVEGFVGLVVDGFVGLVVEGFVGLVVGLVVGRVVVTMHEK